MPVPGILKATKQTKNRKGKGSTVMTKDKPYEVKVQPLKNYQPCPWHECTYIDQGDEFVKMTYMKNKVKTHVRRIDATHYENLRTGEIKEYNAMSEKSKYLAKRASLTRAMDGLRGLIRANFVSSKRDGAHKQVMITLTYAEMEYDTKKLSQDFKKFIMRLEHEYSESQFEYIAVFEPHGSGAWHIHLLLKHLNRGALWIPKERLAERWGKGYVTIERLKASDAGAYYAAYFTSLQAGGFNEDGDDLETGEQLKRYEEAAARLAVLTGQADDESKAYTKARVKGARLHHYPKHFKFYTCSRGVKRPEKRTGIVGLPGDDKEYKEVYSTGYKVVKVYDDVEEEPEVLNEICHRTYRRRRCKE
jgi:hypothetical protein